MAEQTTLAELTETPETDEQDLGGETTGEETTDEQQATDEPEGEKKKLGGYQRKLIRLQRENELKAQELAYWKAQALRSGSGDTKAEEKAKPTEGKPQADAYDSQADYFDALTDWKVDQRLKAEDEKREQARLRAQQEQEQVTFRERLDVTRKKYEDFDDVMDAADIPMSAVMREAILTSDKGPELAYWLAKHPKDAARIAELPFVAAGRELGKIEAQFAVEQKPGPQRKQSTSLTPITTVNAPPGTVSGAYREGKTDYREFRRLREAGKL